MNQHVKVAGMALKPHKVWEVMACTRFFWLRYPYQLQITYQRTAKPSLLREWLHATPGADEKTAEYEDLGQLRADFQKLQDTCPEASFFNFLEGDDGELKARAHNRQAIALGSVAVAACSILYLLASLRDS